ncbi:MAG: nucleotidyl transferase AbiEii/AbiGii toxin family protein [Gammaproteobacteria bacterium]|uniref:nucleotidyl transferase AbiEii/AbiGii toxin family protein n=1 Tax=Rhodoferax sp. TaxID=50421 RepID=UPI0017A1D35D|nr:nucleotidyl transferase AbiEii/AbiGii toxin family protein [Rhodoferax sp.]MBU3898590.1 nucleotidyl transferase AbiEii/AbiGii toxin family protein [Gammaproteobacteria bacterium]MBA3057416.1 nucleotidyl transferase AbiEii/AbiGii toxin family protein [Rhodoferax sp.]MBU3997693.1 nucleotidyl transferase AbiEii/AbiGii toxin family protein [Gammaproteobacteria bacterium]MBU4019499.1 nucleotidyl transferase AbiEii/AbiGii toxin family protein [Gammaproteobacteria bacterium]MBU4079013.1 nucleotidy
MAKRQLTAAQAFDLRQALHVATLDALMTSRRWEPGDIVFQGGTSLHLAHGSPRFSEDLDFLVNATLKLDSISEAIKTRLEGTNWLPAGTSLSVSKAKDGRNPHAFVVTIGGPEVIGAVRVKVELWQTDEVALSAIKAVVAPVKLARGPAAGMQAFVPTADLPEIYADKVFALAARPYLKPRDVFDLHWLDKHSSLHECSVDDLRVRLATYPNETPAAWLNKALARRVELQKSTTAITNDLKRWLPSSWPLNETSVKEMVATAVHSLEQGINMMREIDAEYRDDDESPGA